MVNRFCWAFLSLLSTHIFGTLYASAETNDVEKLLLAYDKYRDSWLASDIMIWCDDDSEKFKLKKNSFGKEVLQNLEDGVWVEIPNVKINDYSIKWTEKKQKISHWDVLSNHTKCKGSDTWDCKYPDRFGDGLKQFIGIWRFFHPTVSSSNFHKYFTITSTSDVANSIRIDRGYYSRKYTNNIQKIEATVSKKVSNPPDSNASGRITLDEYKLSPSGSGKCRVVE